MSSAILHLDFFEMWTAVSPLLVLSDKFAEVVVRRLTASGARNSGPLKDQLSYRSGVAVQRAPLFEK